MAEAGWRELLAEGRAGAALGRYGEEGDLDGDTYAALRLLNLLQDDLRGRDYEAARARVDRREDAPPLLDWAELERQLALLAEAARDLEPKDPVPTLERLEEVTHPLLQAEADTLRGTCRIFLNETDLARAAFERALERDAKHYRAITNLGNLALEGGEVDVAIARYETALLLNGDFANAHHNLGVAYRRKGQVGRSVRSLRRAQGVQQKKLREEARQTLRRGAGASFAKYGRWLLYGVVGVALYLVLRAQGFL